MRVRYRAVNAKRKSPTTLGGAAFLAGAFSAAFGAIQNVLLGECREFKIHRALVWKSIRISTALVHSLDFLLGSELLIGAGDPGWIMPRVMGRSSFMH